MTEAKKIVTQRELAAAMEKAGYPDVPGKHPDAGKHAGHPNWVEPIGLTPAESVWPYLGLGDYLSDIRERSSQDA